MHAEKSNFTISRIARLLEVPRSGFYAWSNRVPSKRVVRQERIEAKVAWFHGESDQVCGAPRILADLREDGETISRKTVATTMRRLGLVGICPKKWKATTIVDHADAYPADAAKSDNFRSVHLGLEVSLVDPTPGFGMTGECGRRPYHSG